MSREEMGFFGGWEAARKETRHGTERDAPRHVSTFFVDNNKNFAIIKLIFIIDDVKKLIER